MATPGAAAHMVAGRRVGLGVSVEISKHEKLLDFSRNLYDNDPDFRESVEAAYRELQREHLVIAAERNSSARASQAALDSESIYPNPQVQDLVNDLGQRVTAGAPGGTFVFRVLLDPLPSTEALSTGTIYISTGMLSLARNESQLAWVLAREVSHVRRADWKEKVMMALGEETLQARQAQNAALLAGTGSGLGPVIGGTFSDASLLASEELRSRTGLLGALGMWNATSHRTATGDLRQQSAPAEAFDSWTLTSPVVVEWSRLQEDGADADALMAMRKLNYDVREVPKLLQAVNRIADADPRVRLSFFAEKKRLDERLAWLRGRISTASADVGMGTDWTGDFARAMAEVNRDTGILAFRSDLLEMARENLASARNVLSGDPAVHYYYGRTLQALAQDSSQRREAAAELLQAVQHDSYGQFNDAQLHWAVLLLDSPTRDDTAIREALQSYVEKYVAAHRSEDRSKWLPPDIGWIRNYMTASGTQGWVPKLPDGRPMTFSEASPSNPK